MPCEFCGGGYRDGEGGFGGGWDGECVAVQFGVGACVGEDAKKGNVNFENLKNLLSIYCWLSWIIL